MTPQQKLQHEFFHVYRAYRGDACVSESLYSSFDPIPLRCDPPARGQYTRCEYWGGSTSSGVLYNVPEPTLRGEHVLANIDLVIHALRLSGINSVPPINISIAPSTADLTGHGFDPTYLDVARAAYARTRGLITQSLDALVN